MFFELSKNIFTSFEILNIHVPNPRPPPLTMGTRNIPTPTF